MLRAMADRGQLTRDGNDRSAAIGGGISRGLVGLLAVASGATVANMYYSQPLLHTLGRAFHVSNATAGLLFTISRSASCSALRSWSRWEISTSGAVSSRRRCW